MKTNRLLLAFTLLILLAASRLPAQVVTPNPSPTIITTAPYHITQSGFYQLGANLNYAGTGNFPDAIIYVEAANVTLDLGGHYLSGPVNTPGTILDGVYSYEYANINIQNGTISHCLSAVELDGNGQSSSNNINHRISNLLIKSCYYAGVNLEAASYSQVNDCRISFIGGSTAQNYQGYALGVSTPNSGRGNQINRNTITDINAGSIGGSGIFAAGANVTGNTIDKVTGSSSAIGIDNPSLATGNSILNVSPGTGIVGASKYANNLTVNCATAFQGGTDAGGNN